MPGLGGDLTIFDRCAMRRSGQFDMIGDLTFSHAYMHVYCICNIVLLVHVYCICNIVLLVHVYCICNIVLLVHVYCTIVHAICNGARQN